MEDNFLLYHYYDGNACCGSNISHDKLVLLCSFRQKDKDNTDNKHDVVKKQLEQNCTCQCKDSSPDPKGTPGNKHEIGMEGKRGRKGATGPSGLRGDAGSRGPQGIIDM